MLNDWTISMVSEAKAPTRYETARLALRQPDMADATAIFERYAGDPVVTRLLGWPRHRSLDDTRAFLEFSAREWQRWPAGPYLIVDRVTGQLLGGTGLAFHAPNEAMTGYVLALDAWGRGYATEALAAMVELANRLRLTRLSALCHPDHQPSRRVLEKNGFVLDNPPLRRVAFPNLDPVTEQDAVCYLWSPR